LSVSYINALKLVLQQLTDALEDDPKSQAQDGPPATLPHEEYAQPNQSKQQSYEPYK